jgi:hypothetical protein
MLNRAVGLKRDASHSCHNFLVPGRKYTNIYVVYSVSNSYFLPQLSLFQIQNLPYLKLLDPTRKIFQLSRPTTRLKGLSDTFVTFRKSQPRGPLCSLSLSVTLLVGFSYSQFHNHLDSKSEIEVKMLVNATFAILASTAALASPYLEFCEPSNIQTVGSQGIVIQAFCNDRCAQLNIVPCFANSYGTIVPAGLTYVPRFDTFSLSPQITDQLTLAGISQQWKFQFYL